MTEKAQKRRPFHETIVDAIGGMTSIYDLHLPAVLAKLIKETRIPAGHDEIILAWRQQFAKMHKAQGQVWREGDNLGVVASLLEQKKEAEDKAAKKLEEAVSS